MDVAEELSGVNNEPVSTMTLCGLSSGSLELLRGAFHPNRPAKPKGQEVAAHLRRLVVTAPTPAPGSSEDEGSTRWAPRVWISRHIVRTWWKVLVISLVCCRRRFAFSGMGALFEDGGVVKPYMDSALRHHKERYLSFLRQLRSKGMLKFVERAKAQAGVFLSIKLPRPCCGLSSMLDWEICFSKFLLRSNCVPLRLSHESRLNLLLAFLRKNLFLPAFQGSAWRWVRQMSDRFQNMRTPSSLGAWFCLPQVTTGEMDVVGMDLGNEALGPYDLIFRVLLHCRWVSVGVCTCVSVWRKRCSNVPHVSKSVHRFMIVKASYFCRNVRQKGVRTALAMCT